jgi:hypothetical protein
MKCRCLNPVHMKVSINVVITLLFRVTPFPDGDLIICFISRELCASIGLTPADTWFTATTAQPWMAAVA